MEEQLLTMMKILLDEIRALRQDFEEFRGNKIIKVKKRLDIDSCTVAEAAKLIERSISCIRKAIGDGRLTAYKNRGGRTMVMIDSLKNL